MTGHLPRKMSFAGSTLRVRRLWTRLADSPPMRIPVLNLIIGAVAGLVLAAVLLAWWVVDVVWWLLFRSGRSVFKDVSDR